MFCGGGCLQEATCSVKRRRALLGGLCPPSADAAGGGRVSPYGGPWATRLCGREADAAAALGPHAQPGEGQPPAGASPRADTVRDRAPGGRSRWRGHARPAPPRRAAVGQRCRRAGQGTCSAPRPAEERRITAMPCSVPCTTNGKSGAARHAARFLRQGRLRVWAPRNTVPGPRRRRG